MKSMRSIEIMEQNGKTRSKRSAIIIMGLALFATQFGAGNLIFPPFLGRDTGSSWFVGFIGFFLMDVGLAVAAIIATVSNKKGGVDGVMGKIGRIPGKAMVTAIIICLGPLIAIPRTAATTYEMGIKLLIPGLPQWAFGAIFYGIALLLVIRPTKVVDIIGNYLTPILLAVMVLLIVIGIVNPIDEAAILANASPMHDGIVNGYQTLDGIGGVPQTLMMITAACAYGYTTKDEIRQTVSGSAVISGTLLALVYGGLTYLGSTVSGIAEFKNLEQAPLLMAITNRLLGNYGVIALTIIVLMACLTTAIGLSAVVGDYFKDLTNGKMQYKYTVVAVIVFSYILSNFGLSNIIALAGPILSILYPPLIVLVVMTLLEKVVKNEMSACVGAYVSLLASLAGTLPMGALSDMAAKLPFAADGLGWFVPAVIGCVVGAFIPKPQGKKAENLKANANLD